ncbi:hypothetical protein V7x_54670 [Crateriforma conspicua]|uniref:Leucine Rich repeats (2 copies) n=1 Tax=Crateriforma conspicua TaxID=2527996 RepID=A0A5C6FDZ8_9PLAN|nr:hypothetical protein [Crateriforma conspicua]TWU59693.1 hypothetical protein V7x_54670 [Crateriforma conspicua]
MNQRKSIANALLFVALTVTALVVVNLPHRYVDRDPQWMRRGTSNDLLPLQSPRPRIMAGWPVRYLIQHESYDKSRTRWWSLAALSTDIAVALALAALVGGFTWYRHRAMIRSDDPRRLRRRLDRIMVAGILVFIGICAARTGWTSYQHHRVAQGVFAKGGDCYRSCILPETIAQRIPSGFLPLFRRVIAVDVIAPDDALVRRITLLPTLRTLDISGETYDQSLLGQLAGHHELSAIRLRRKDLRPESMVFLQTLPQLQQLDFQRCNVGHEHLLPLRRLNELVRLNFSRTPLRLETVSNFLALPQRIEVLELSRPPIGQTDSLVIDGWDSLRRIKIDRDRTVRNHTPLRLVIRNCPNLRKLDLDRFQKYDLDFENLPRLADFGEEIGDLFIYIKVHDSIPGMTWVRNLRLKDVPSLEHISCSALDLQSLKIEGLTSIKSLELGGQIVTGFGMLSPQPIAKELRQRLIDDLGRCEGPSRLCFQGMSLSDLDLQPLNENQGIRSLDFARSDITFAQVQSLAPMGERLDEILLDRCPLEKKDLSWMLKTFPKAQSIGVNLYDSSDIRIVSNDQLELMLTSVIDKPRQVTIVDAPKLRSSLLMLDSPRKLDIRNAPSLQGVAVGGVWPKDCRFKGLRKLRWFAGGGPTLSNDVFDQLLDCRRLDELTLAYSGISKDRLRKVGLFRQLTVLNVPGSDVDDDVADHWRGIERIQHLDLSDTQIGHRTLHWATGLPNLRSLSINGVPLDKRSSRLLSNLGDLQYIHVGDTNADVGDLIPTLHGEVVMMLDVSGLTLTDAFIDAAINAKALKRIRIDRCDMTPEQLQRLVDRSRPDLRIDIDPGHPALSDQLAGFIDERNRLAGRPFQLDPSEAALASLAQTEGLQRRWLTSRRASFEAFTRPGKIDTERLRQILNR